MWVGGLGRRKFKSKINSTNCGSKWNGVGVLSDLVRSQRKSHIIDLGAILVGVGPEVIICAF